MVSLTDLPPDQRAIVTRGARAAAEVQRLRKEQPLAFVTLWVPECRTCPHPSEKVRKGSPHFRGMPLVQIGPKRQQCPSCGTIRHFLRVTPSQSRPALSVFAPIAG